MDFNRKLDLIKIYLAVGLTIFGCMLLIASFIIEPTGIIAESVLISVGEVFTFAGTLIGIQKAYSIKHRELENKLENKIEEKLKNNNENV